MKEWKGEVVVVESPDLSALPHESRKAHASEILTSFENNLTRFIKCIKIVNPFKRKTHFIRIDSQHGTSTHSHGQRPNLHLP